MPVSLRECADGDALAADLAGYIAQRLQAATAARGSALLAVSGGRTPVRLFEALSHGPVDWARVVVMLVDERWVGEDSERSNARLVRRHLLQGPAAAARFVGLHGTAPDVDAGRDAVEATLATLPWPLTVAVLGMGDDGHTASFFPGGDRLAACLDPATPRRVETLRAAGAGEPRLTLTLPVLLAAETLVLHIEGAGKRTVLERALGPGPVEALPVRAVLRGTGAPIEVWWCP